MRITWLSRFASLTVLGLITSNAGCGGDCAQKKPETTHAACTDTVSRERQSPGQQVDRARLLAAATRLDKLSEGVMGFWLKYGPDTEHGGFHGTLDREGRPSEPTDKGLIQQARHLFSLSTWYEMVEKKPEVKALADNLYRFLADHFREPHTSEFVLTVSREGAVKNPARVLYAQSFAIYGLVQYARVFENKEAGKLALECFRSIDASHDPIHGGYFRPNDPPWLTAGAMKETNTHLHLLEAFTALAEYSQDPVVKARLAELFDLFLTRIAQKEGYAALDFAMDFSPFGPKKVSYGHDLETSWLLFEAATLLGRTSDPVARGVILKLGHNSSVWGFDTARGGYFDGGIPGGAVTQPNKIWWVQAEAIPSLVRLFLLTHEPQYLDRLEATIRWIEEHQQDREYGEWYWGVLPDLSLDPERGAHKGSEWKSSYHQIRGLLYGARWLREVTG